MTRRYVVAVNTLTQDQDAAFAKALNDAGLDWWHWIGNFWLIIDRNERHTAANFRDYLNTIMAGRYSMVMEVYPGSDWAGFGPHGEKFDMGNWIQSRWLSDD